MLVVGFVFEIDLLLLTFGKVSESAHSKNLQLSGALKSFEHPQNCFPLLGPSLLTVRLVAGKEHRQLVAGDSLDSLDLMTRCFLVAIVLDLGLVVLAEPLDALVLYLPLLSEKSLSWSSSSSSLALLLLFFWVFLGTGIETNGFPGGKFPFSPSSSSLPPSQPPP